MTEIETLADAKQHLSKYKVVIFDLDDTLYSERDYVKSGYKAISNQFNIIENMAEKLYQAFKDGKKAINYVLQNEDCFSDENLVKCLEIYRNHLPEISVYNEAIDLINFLLKKRIRLGMITDGRPEGQRNKINSLGIKNFFDKIIITDELGGIEFRKPHTRAFEEMQNFFQVPYEDMVYIGDNISKDFIAPEKLKMGSVYFKNPLGLYINT